jgi:hypothetical protein
MRIKTGDFFMALGLLALSAALYHQSGEIDTTMIYALGPVFFPKLLIGILAALSLVLLWQSVDIKGNKGWCASARTGSAHAAVLRWSLVGLVILYLVALPLAGYLLATIPFLFAGMCLLGPLKPRNLAIYGVTSLLVTFGLQFIFGTLLKLFLP